MDLHKDLLDYQGELASEHHQRNLSSFEIWDLSIKDKDFIWLRKLSELIIIIDEAVEEGRIEKQFTSWLEREVRAIFFSEDEAFLQFKSKLSVALAKRPELHFLVGRLKRLVG